MIKFVILCYLIVSVKSEWSVKNFEYPRGNATEIIWDSIPMKVDHFTWNNYDTFELRFAYNNEFFSHSAPLFIIIGGEMELECLLGYLENGPIYQMAKETDGYLCIIEHRFYGTSVPYSSLALSKLKYLTIEQVLRDLAYFVTNRKLNVPGLEDSKVVIVGSSYGASLAAWSRLMYPDVIDIAYSSSGIFNVKPSNYEFNEIVQNILSKNKECLNTIKTALKTIRQMTETMEGTRKLNEDFNICEDFDASTREELSIVPDLIIALIGNVVQFNQPIRNNSMGKMCDILLTDVRTMDDYQRLVRFVNLVYNTSRDCTLINYREMIDLYRSEIPPNNDRIWNYQLCTQIGSFMTTDSEDQPFGDTLPLSYLIRICRDVFDFKFPTVNIYWETLWVRGRYGGLQPPVTRTIFTVGSKDPWSGIGMKDSPNDESELIIIDGTSHCQDLMPEKDEELPSLRKARKKIKVLIYSWLA